MENSEKDNLNLESTDSTFIDVSDNNKNYCEISEKSKKKKKKKKKSNKDIDIQDVMDIGADMSPIRVYPSSKNKNKKIISSDVDDKYSFMNDKHKKKKKNKNKKKNKK